MRLLKSILAFAVMGGLLGAAIIEQREGDMSDGEFLIVMALLLIFSAIIDKKDE